MPYQDNAWAVILAGGQGTRLWPLSRRRRPKQFLDLQGNGRTLLQQTAARAVHLVGSLERVLIVTNAQHAALAREQLPGLPVGNLLLEPEGRNTAASIGLAAIHLQHRNPQAVMAVLPADHLYRDQAPWLEALQSGLAHADRSGDLVTFGIQPHLPSTRYGYLQQGKLLSQDHPRPVYTGLKFLEKPDEQRARELVNSGEYLWNTGTFAWRVDAILEAIGRCLPAMYDSLQKIADQPESLNQLFPELPAISIDYGVLEKTGAFAIVAADFERIDLGALSSLEEILPVEENGNQSISELIAVEAYGNLIYNPGRLTVMLGVDDLVIAADADVLLICRRDQVGRIPQVVAQLQRSGQERYL